MASSSPSQNTVHKFPQTTYIDALRWLPKPSPFTRHVVLSTFDPQTSIPSLQTLTFSDSQITPQSSAPISVHSRVTSLKVSPSVTNPLVAASSIAGSILFFSVNSSNGSLVYKFEVGSEEGLGFHRGAVSGIDVSENGVECVSVGEDGRVNSINLVRGEVGFRRIYDSNGLVAYSAVKWASPMEFVTGGLGFGLHWWDQRKNGGPVATFKENWTRGTSSGIVHCVDVHPSRKHTCIAGGSSGTVFAWDLRQPTQPVLLSGTGPNGAPQNPIVESDVWEIQYDNYTHSSKINNMSSSRILPSVICSEDGILGVLEQGEEPVELLAEPCAINSFDIDRQNPSDVICSLEWESVAIVSRP